MAMTEKIKVATLGCEKNLAGSEMPEIDGDIFHSNCIAEIVEIAKVFATHCFEFDISGEGIA
jgi:hypothetical protein